MRYVLKILLFILVLIGLNELYYHTWYPKDAEEYADILKYMEELPDEIDVLYLAESSNNNIRKSDQDQRMISEMMEDYLPNYQIEDITRPASHADVYYHWLLNVPEDKSIHNVVVTMNLRSFNAQWTYSNLETHIQRSLVMYRPGPVLWRRIMLAFKAYDIKTNEEREQQFLKKWEEDVFTGHDVPYRNLMEWDQAQSNGSILDSAGNWDMENIALSCHYIKAYAFQIDTLNDPRLKQLDDIVKLSKERGWNLVFNLLAENTEKSAYYFGDQLNSFMYENRDKLVAYFKNRGVMVVDHLDSVPDEEFTDQNWTTEHYGEKGRRMIAERTAEVILANY